MTDDLANVRLTVTYDGREYYGWQRHKGKPTIQGALEKAVEEVFGFQSLIEGAGRTDRGTHANGQVATVRLPRGLEPEAIAAALGGALPEDLGVLDAAYVPDDFHARKSATGKTYRYVIWNEPDLPVEHVDLVWHIPGALDVAAMQAACPHFIGEHDFASFAKKPNFKQATTVRHIKDAHLRHEAPVIEITLEADGFLYKMVRNIVRSIVKVGEGRYTPDDIPRLMAARDRQAAPGTAPASGLYLDRVHYGDEG